MSKPPPEAGEDGVERQRTPGPGEVVVVAKEHPYTNALRWRVLDVAPSRHISDAASWHRPPYTRATGRAFIARERYHALGGPVSRKLVRVLDRHPGDDWDDVSEATLRAQLERAYLPPLGWVERHGQTGVGWRRDRGAAGGHYAAPTVAAPPAPAPNAPSTPGPAPPGREEPFLRPEREANDWSHADARRARRERNA